MNNTLEYFYSKSDLLFLLLVKTALSSGIAHSEIKRQVPN